MGTGPPVGKVVAFTCTLKMGLCLLAGTGFLKHHGNGKLVSL